jgi:hypothetical protein
MFCLLYTSIFSLKPIRNQYLVVQTRLFLHWHGSTQNQVVVRSAGNLDRHGLIVTEDLDRGRREVKLLSVARLELINYF